MAEFKLEWPEILTPEGILIRRKIEAMDDSWRVLQTTKSPLAQQGFVDWRNWMSKISVKTLFIDPELGFEIGRWQKRYDEARAEVDRMGEKTLAPTQSELSTLLYGTPSWFFWMLAGTALTLGAQIIFLRKRTVVAQRVAHGRERVESGYRQLKQRAAERYRRLKSRYV